MSALLHPVASADALFPVHAFCRACRDLRRNLRTLARRLALQAVALDHAGEGAARLQAALAGARAELGARS